MVHDDSQLPDTPKPEAQDADKRDSSLPKQPDRPDSDEIQLELDIGALFGAGLRQLVKTASQLNSDGATIAQRLRELDGKVERREFQSQSGQRGVASIRLRSRFLDETPVAEEPGDIGQASNPEDPSGDKRG